MKTKHLSRLLTVAIAALAPFALVAAPASANLINGGFDGYGVAPGVNGFVTDTNFAGWRTTASDQQIEVWGTGFLGVPSYSGSAFAELNANEVSTLYQDVSGIPAASLIGFEFAHRGRAGADTLRLTITDLGGDNVFGGGDDTTLFTDTYTDDTTAWGFYSNPTPIVGLGNNVRFAYESVSSAGGATIGNFLDAASFGVGVGATVVPEPGTFALVGMGALALTGVMGRRRKASAAA